MSRQVWVLNSGGTATVAVQVAPLVEIMEQTLGNLLIHIGQSKL